ncbi:MAG: GNAT family N-acetyltransferase [Acholeplasmataceae bacterium]|nr:GNAT family N-acetyltransferase [Acholeplasmataceae bacterium]
MIKKSLLEAQNDFFAIWNQEFPDYPLTERIFQERIHSSALIVPEGKYALYEDGRLLGLLCLKSGHPDDPTQNDVIFLSLIYIAPDFRHRGYGRLLIREAENIARSLGKKYLLTGCDHDNLFSGVFVNKNEEVHQFFQREGFFVFDQNYNLLASTRLPEVDSTHYRVAVSEEEKEAVLKLISSHFYPRWFYDISLVPYQDLVLALDGDDIQGFLHIADCRSPILPNSLSFYSRYRNLGGIGPLGLVPEARGKGFGKGMVIYAVNQLFDRGCSDVLVDWTDKTEFYIKCGFEKVCDHFIVYGRIL